MSFLQVEISQDILRINYETCLRQIFKHHTLKIHHITCCDQGLTMAGAGGAAVPGPSDLPRGGSQSCAITTKLCLEHFQDWKHIFLISYQ